ncbi:hypothetical protein KJ762_02505 [bacterium]|nr:hypothetical protein [bacterium]MBU1633364.1 hypothetical protein [bacterium]MBU1873094.1 hypothetical protein [bacterium]
MKIKELKANLQTIRENLTFKYEEGKNPQGQPTVSVFLNLINFRNGINSLETTSLLKNEINQIKTSGIFSTAKDELTLNVTEGRSIKLPMDSLLKIVNALNESLSQITGATRENSISIKLPNVNDFEDLAKTSNTFHTILSQTIINDEIKGQIKIDSVENGSIWLDIYLGSATALSLVGGLAWSGAVVYKKIQEGRIIEEHVKSLKIKNESLKEIKDAQKKAIDLMIEAEANQLYSENFKTDDNHEQIERLKHSIKLLAEQIDKGAEVHPALNTPEKVANLFPNMKHLELVESKIKKLTE